MIHTFIIYLEKAVEFAKKTASFQSKEAVNIMLIFD